MNIINRTENIILTTALIVLGGILTYFTILEANNFRLNKIETLKQRFQETGEQDILLQIGILNPTKKEITEIIPLILEGGDYQTADSLGTIYDVPAYNFTAAQSALFRKDIKNGDRYLKKMPDSEQKDELIAFKTYIESEEPIYQLLTTNTDAGKFMYMINERDFNLYVINNGLGRKLSDNNKRYPDRLQNLLYNAQTLADYGFYYQAISILDNKIFSCNIDFYIYKASLYLKVDYPNKGLKEIENGLVCDSTNVELLRTAIRYSRLLSHDLDADNYQMRLEQIENLGNM